MNHRTIRSTLIASSLVAAALASGSAHAVLQGRNMDGNAATFEAYYDTVLDITWLADANAGAGSAYDDVGTGGTTADGKMTWANANTWAASLSFTNSLTNQTYADWRLPTVKPVNGVSFNNNYSTDGSTDYGYNITSPQSEMSHLFYVTLGNPGQATPTGAVSGCYVNPSNTCLDNVGPFINLQANDSYWSATEYVPSTGYAPSTGLAWASSFDFGSQNATDAYNDFYALAVSPGDVAAVPEAETYALMLAGLGLIGWRARRRG